MGGLHGGGTNTMVTSSHDSSAATFKYDSPQTLPNSVSLPLIPSLLVLNLTSLAKPNVIQQLHTDIISHGAHIAVITETWCKNRHSVEITQLSGHMCYRKDRVARVGGVLRQTGQ